jgi:hypothetical protein
MQAQAQAATERVGEARAGLLPQVYGAAEYLRSTFIRRRRHSRRGPDNSNWPTSATTQASAILSNLPTPSASISRMMRHTSILSRCVFSREGYADRLYGHIASVSSRKMKTKTLRIAGMISSALLFVASLSACAPTESNAISAAQYQRTLQRLAAARESDLSNSKDPEVGPVASGDYSIRADKVEQVMDEIEHGQYVSQSRIREALFVPPKTLSEAQRARLIDELKYARDLDNAGWWDWTRDPVIAQDFAVQEKKANRAIRDLETNQQISWTEIDEGLHVPRYP